MLPIHVLGQVEFRMHDLFKNIIFKLKREKKIFDFLKMKILCNMLKF